MSRLDAQDERQFLMGAERALDDLKSAQDAQMGTPALPIETVSLRSVTTAFALPRLATTAR